MEKIYDLIIIGAGPAGLSAGIYASRSRLSTLIFEKGRAGGQIVTTAEVANYPGSLHDEGSMDTTGPKLVARMVQQAEHFGAERVMKEIKNFDFSGDIKTVSDESGNVYKTKTIIAATGAVPRKAGFIGEKEFTGKGVSYCATCDADFFTDLEVFCIGGGYAAVEEAMYLAKFARKVTLVVRKPHFRCPESIVEKALANPKISVMFNTEVISVEGDGVVERATFKNNVTGDVWMHEAHEDDGTFGVFVFTGYDPNTEIFKGHLDMDEHNYILTNENLATNIPGIFAAGDLRPKLLKQVITAAADGALAATAAEKYIENHFE